MKSAFLNIISTFLTPIKEVNAGLWHIMQRHNNKMCTEREINKLKWEKITKVSQERP
jgi:hypothetical protein